MKHENYVVEVIPIITMLLESIFSFSRVMIGFCRRKTSENGPVGWARMKDRDPNRK